ncbi:hypothetical protein ACIRRA_00355 [Nocardia sp. NPDC101769]|uniref:hypothetical protein n=1 Tax=Nocardia sp. NPDC101769 TaxID=3364333 RepID=UPI00381E75DF
MSGPGQTPQNVGRVTGFLLIAAAVLTVAMFWLPVVTVQLRGSAAWDVYVWKSGGYGRHTPSTAYFAAVPYALMVVGAGVVGTLLAVGMGARRRVLFWVAALAGGMVLQIASSDVVRYARGFGDGSAPASGFWVITLMMLVAIAALVSGLRDAVVSRPGAGSEQGGGAADRVTGVFLVVAAVVDLLRSRLPLVSGHQGQYMTIWDAGAGSVPWSAVHFALGTIAVVVVAVALLAGAGVRNPAVRAASGAAAAFIFANAIGALSVAFSVMGLNFWEYASSGFWLAVVMLVLSFAATVAGLVAQLAKPRLQVAPRPGYAPGFLPTGPVPAGPGGGVNPFAPAPAPNPFAPVGQPVASAPNPFAPEIPAPNPFAPATPAPNPFAPATPAPNPFAPPAPGVEATVKLAPEQAAPQPPRMAKVYDGKDADGRPVANRDRLEGNTRTAVLAYLESAPIVLAARSFEQDEFAPADRDVPLNFRTDGVWVWAGAVAHYLHKHGLPPEAELVQHITSRGFRVGEVSDAAQDAAVRVITGS